ncbi:MAG: flagellar basal body protein [Rhizomicrobium sp.]
MNLPDVPLMSMLRQQMTWLQARQNVLSQNVSNADTPGYVANDVKPMDFEQILQGGNPKFHPGLTVTDDHHIAITPSSQDIETVPTGASVSLEQEMINVSDTQAKFQAATNLYSKALSMMRTAIDKQSS